MKLSGWDKFTLALAPRWTLERLKARAAANVIARHYEAAQPGRRTSGWTRSAADADLNIRGAIVELRMHTRDLIRNNAWARRGQRVIANNTAGWGIVPNAIGTGADQAAALWKAWAETSECDAAGRHNFYGLQHLVMKSVVESGEVLLRRRWRKKRDGLTVPFQINVLEADYLDHNKNFLDSDAGGPIIQGVEFDKIGRRAAYWLYNQHPGSGRNYEPSKRISAEDVIHVFYSERPGQTRGVPWFAPAILNLKDFDDFEDATLLRQKIAACFAVFVTDVDGNVSLATPGDNGDVTSTQAETVSPGMIEYLPPGKDVRFGNPPLLTDGAFTKGMLRRIAQAIGVTYEDLTGDYSEVNFSAARMSRLAHQSNVHDWRWNMLVPLMCDGVWAWVMDAALMVNALPSAPEASVPGVEWTDPPLPMIEPDKEGLAYQRAVRTGFMTFSDMIRQQGKNPDTHFAEYASDLKRLDAMGIKLDSDVRAVSQAGQEQPPDAGATDPAK